jgi:hypothetical protein
MHPKPLRGLWGVTLPNIYESSPGGPAGMISVILRSHFQIGAPVSDPARWSGLQFRAGSETGAPYLRLHSGTDF